MSWSDPFEQFYQDDAEKRIQQLGSNGFYVGSIIILGPRKGARGTFYAYEQPDISSKNITIDKQIQGVIISISLDDIVEDWFYVMINGNQKMFCWVPSSIAKVYTE